MITAGPLKAIPLITGSVVNSSAFEKGGTLVLGSFRAGPGAAADDETDQLSSMMMKGINDTLPALNSHYTIPTNDQKGSDCFLDGFIEVYGRERRITHRKLNKNQTFLSVDGQIWSRDTGERIFLFQTSYVIDLKAQDPKTVAYQIGVAIANFVGSYNIGIRGKG